MCDVFIHEDHWWHSVLCKVMILVGNMSILSDFFFTFVNQNVHMSFPWQRVGIWMKRVSITWFCV